MIQEKIEVTDVKKEKNFTIIELLLFYIQIIPLLLLKKGNLILSILMRLGILNIYTL